MLEHRIQKNRKCFALLFNEFKVVNQLAAGCLRVKIYFVVTATSDECRVSFAFLVRRRYTLFIGADPGFWHITWSAIELCLKICKYNCECNIVCECKSKMVTTREYFNIVHLLTRLELKRCLIGKDKNKLLTNIENSLYIYQFKYGSGNSGKHYSKSPVQWV